MFQQGKANRPTNFANDDLESYSVLPVLLTSELFVSHELLMLSFGGPGCFFAFIP